MSKRVRKGVVKDTEKKKSGTEVQGEQGIHKEQRNPHHDGILH